MQTPHGQIQDGQTSGEHPLSYHLMGIGGIGVSALARLLRARGHRVSGCDRALSELTEQLQAEGIGVFEGHDASHIANIDVLVASNAVSPLEPELVAARGRGVRIARRMEMLGDLMRGSPSIGVVGTHGKTTTTSMIAVALSGAGLDPSAFVGGVVPEFGSNARLGAGPFVAEVDESDSDFARLQCETAVVTNAEDDHVGTPDKRRATYYANLDELTDAFRGFVKGARRVLYCADWPNLADLVTEVQDKLSYGTLEDCDYRAANVVRTPEGSRYTALRRGEKLGEIAISFPGEHNVLNSLAAVAVADLYGADFAKVAAALENFRGPGRRWQRVGELNGAPVIDDYAHNATKVAAALDGARQSGRRVRVVFQPHRYLRTRQSWPRLAQSLMAADEVLILDIASAGEDPIEGVHATLIEERMRRDGHQNVRYLPDRAEVVAYLRATAQPGDLIVTMGAGDVYKLARELAQEATQEQVGA